MFSSFKRWLFAGLGFLCGIGAASAVSAQVILPAPTAPAPVTALEYFINTDPGFGNGVAIPVTPGMDIATSASVALSSLPPGIHRVYLRAKNANGVWGLTNLRLFYLAPTFSFSTAVPAVVTALEYFFDHDPGFGAASPLPVTPGQDITATGAVTTAALSEGVHYFGVRAKNSLGRWGLTSLMPVYVLPNLSLPAHPATAPIVRAEYFVDTDPGFGLATGIPLTGGTEVTIPGFIANLGTLGSGVHHLVIRFQDANGNWSLSDGNKLAVVVADIHIPPAIPAQPFTTLEYFVDTDPGMGNGTLLSVPATTDLSSFSFAADISGLADGTHVLFARTVGQWSLTSSQSFTIGDPLPVTLLHFNAQKEKTSVRLEWKTGMEKDNKGFVLERSADAKLFDSLGFVAAKGGHGNTYSFTDETPLNGTGYYRLKQTDLSGESTYSQTVAIRFEQQTPGLFTCNNPVRDELRLFSQAHGTAPASFTIHNLQGREVARFTGKGKLVETYNVSQFPAGSYVLQVRVHETVQTLKFQKL